ncbi:DUF3152 domain-containing protein [Angustibacter aerolatus]
MTSSDALRRRRLLAAVFAVLAAVAVGLGVRAVAFGPADPADRAEGAAAPGSASATRPATPTATRSTPTRTPSSTPRASASEAPVKTAEVTVTERGTGVLRTVPGSVPAPGRGTVHRVRVQVEGGVDVDPVAFADAVMATLNDPRSWGHGGRMTFARTDGRADITVVLASPDTSARLCRPLVTRGRLSCSIGGRAVLTSYRWALATPEFDSVAQYRQYVVNHEVGHALGHHHEFCGERGELAPVMQQQTKQVAPCRPNAWPHPTS